QQPARRDGLPPRSDASARRSGPLPRPVAPQRPAPWAPGQRPLVGKVHSPRSTAVVPRRRRGRWLTHGVPSVLAGVVGIGSFVTLGVSSLLGGAGLLAPLLAGLGIAAVVGGGSAFLLRNREPRPVRLGRGDTEIPAATRTMLEKVVRDSRQQRRRVQRMQRRARGSAGAQILQRAETPLLRIDALLGRAGIPSRPGSAAPRTRLEKVVRASRQQRRRVQRMQRRARGSAVSQILQRAETLLLRIDALLGSAAIQSRRASDAEVMLLEGMADRYVPDLIS